MTTVQVYFCSYLAIMSSVAVLQTTVQVSVGRSSVEEKCERSERMDDLGHKLSLVIAYRESLVVRPVCDMDIQGFQHTIAEH